MANRSHPPHPLIERLPAQLGDAKFRRDQVRIAARSSYDSAGQARYDPAGAAVACGCRQGDYGTATLGELCSTYEVALTTDSTNQGIAGHLCIDLPGEIKFDGGVEREKPIKAREYLGVDGCASRDKSEWRDSRWAKSYKQH